MKDNLQIRGGSMRFIGLCFVLLLAACSPKYDWREMPAANGAIRVQFPARPLVEQREVQINGVDLTLQFQIATVDASVFAVGTATLPPEIAADSSAARALAEGVEASLSQNLNSPLLNKAGFALPLAPNDQRAFRYGSAFELHGGASPAPAWLLARVFIMGDQLVQVIALGSEGVLTREVAETFVQSIRAG